jgi:predicted enzyme related to lactoylglutathione lyase
MDIQLNRIIIFSGNVEKLKQFYQQHFNFTLAEEIKNEWVVLNAGQVEIALHQIGEAYRNNDDKAFRAESNTKLVFKISADIDLFRTRLVQSGVQVQEVKSFPGYNYLLCDGEDPEGNVFQIMAPKVN